MFSIPNSADAAFQAQAEPDARDIDIMAAGASGHGVIQGCAVSAQGVPDMTVAVAVGTVQIGGAAVRKVAAGNVAIGAAHATLNRFDLVCADGTGTKQVIVGTAAAYPVLPAISAGYVVLAAVYVPATDTAIAANQITDKRLILSPLMVTSPGCVRVMSDFSGQAIDMAWSIQSGSGTIAQGTGDADRFGVTTLGSGTLTSSNETIHAGVNAILPGGGRIFGMIGLKTEANLSGATDRYTIRSGLIDNIPNESVDGVFFRYVDNVNAGKWHCVCRSNNTETAADSGVAVAASTRYLLEIDIASDGSSATFSINGSQVATINTNIPTGAGRTTGFGTGIMKNAGTTARSLELDKMDLLFLPLNPY